MIEVTVFPHEVAAAHNQTEVLMHVHQRLTRAGVPALLNLGRGEIICPGLHADVDHDRTRYTYAGPRAN